MRGDDVRQLQIFLISQGLLVSDSATGFFGTLTERAVQDWQRRNEIVARGTAATTGYGAVGPRTRAALISVSARIPVTSSPDTSRSVPTTAVPPAGGGASGGGTANVHPMPASPAILPQSQTPAPSPPTPTPPPSSIDPSTVFPNKFSLLPSGTTYQDTVPNTLDLAERATWFVRGAIQTIAPTLHSTPAGWVGSDQVTDDFWGCEKAAKHPCLFYNWQNWGKVMRALAQARKMTAYDRSDSDHTLETQYRMMKNMLDPVLQQQFSQYFNGSVVLQSAPCAEGGCVSAALLGMHALIAEWKHSSAPGIKNETDAFLQALLDHRKSFTDSSRTYQAFDYPVNTALDTHIGYLGDYWGPFINGKALRVLSEWYTLTGNQKALQAANEVSEFLRNYKNSRWWASPDPSRFPNAPGYFAGHIHSWLQAAIGLAEHAEALRKTDPNSALAEAELNLANDVYNFVKQRTKAGKVGNFGESGSTGDMILLGTKLTEQNVAYYYDEVEAWTRNALVEMQVDASAAQYIPNYQGSTYENTNIGTKVTGMFFADGTHIFVIPFTNLFATTDYAPNSFAGMHEVWKKGVQYKGDFAQINFLINRASQYLDVKSDLPYRGQVEVKMKSTIGPIVKVGVRIPAWADKTAVSVSVRGSDGTERTLATNEWSWVSGVPYVLLYVQPNTSYIVKFPIKVYTQAVYELRTANQMWYEGSYPSGSSPETVVTYQATFRGDTLVDVTPRPSGGIPRYQRSDLASLPSADVAPPTKTVQRFVANSPF